MGSEQVQNDDKDIFCTSRGNVTAHLEDFKKHLLEMVELVVDSVQKPRYNEEL